MHKIYILCQSLVFSFLPTLYIFFLVKINNFFRLIIIKNVELFKFRFINFNNLAIHIKLSCVFIMLNPKKSFFIIIIKNFLKFLNNDLIFVKLY